MTEASAEVWATVHVDVRKSVSVEKVWAKPSAVPRGSTMVVSAIVRYLFARHYRKKGTSAFHLFRRHR